MIDSYFNRKKYVGMHMIYCQLEKKPIKTWQHIKVV